MTFEKRRKGENMNVPTKQHTPSGSPDRGRLRSTVLQQLTALSKLKTPQLREKWRELNGTEPPAYKRQYLLRRLAYRIQEMYYGGLNDQAREQLARVTESDPLAKPESPKSGNKTARPSQLVPGTRLKRRWRGIEYEVLVVDGGFKYQDKLYRSLTAVAIEITGTKWSGRLFFGLPPIKNTKRKKQNA